MRSLKMTESFRIKLHIFVWSYLTSLLVATYTLWKSNWFGYGDLYSFAFVTIFFSLLLSFVAYKVISHLKHLNVFILYITSAALGFLYSLASTFLFLSFIRFILLGAASFPVILCWGLGGIIGSLAGVMARTIECKKLLIYQTVAFGVICFVGIIGYNPLVIAIKNDRELHVVSVKWLPGPQPLTVDQSSVGGWNSKGLKLLEKDLQMINDLGLTGSCIVKGYGVHGNGKVTKAILVISEVPKSKVELPQPDSGTLIYVQEEEGFAIYPTKEHTLRRIIELNRYESNTYTKDSNNVSYLVELASGAMQGGHAVSF